MADHSFSAEVACIVGIPAATIYKNIQHWCAKNRANNENIKNGLAWTYNSVKAWAKQFPYLSESQIRRALLKLEEEQFILSAEYNRDNRDRTKWYADLEPNLDDLRAENDPDLEPDLGENLACQNRQMHLSDSSNAFVKNDNSGSCQNRQTITKYKTNNTLTDGIVVSARENSPPSSPDHPPHDQVAEIRKALEGCIDPIAPDMLRIPPIMDWHDAGYDYDLDILPMVTAFGLRRRKDFSNCVPHDQLIRSWSYFTKMLPNVRRKRLAAAPVVPACYAVGQSQPLKGGYHNNKPKKSMDLYYQKIRELQEQGR